MQNVLIRLQISFDTIFFACLQSSPIFNSLIRLSHQIEGDKAELIYVM